MRPSDTTDGDYSIFFYCNMQDSLAVQRFKIHKAGHQYLMGGRYFDRYFHISSCTKKITVSSVTRYDMSLVCIETNASVDQQIDQRTLKYYCATESFVLV